MKALWVSLKILIFSTLAAQTAFAAEQSLPVKCRFFQAEGNLRQPLRDGDFLVQTTADETTLKLRTSQAELSITVRRGFEQGRRGSEPTVQALEGNYDSQHYVLFFRDGVVIQHKDALGKPLAALSCQGSLVAKIADRLIGTEDGKLGPMAASLVQISNGVVGTQQPQAAPTVQVPAVSQVILPSQPGASAVVNSGLPPGMAENLDILLQPQQ